MIIEHGQMNDNRMTVDSPFKGPFKGKGANRKALRQLENEMAQVNEEMLAVVEQYNQVFPQRQTMVHLRIINRQYPLLWWRVAGNSGSYVRLFNTPDGLAMLGRLMPETQQRLKQFDRLRLRLNFKSTVIGNAIRSYQRYEEGLDALDLLPF